MKKYISIFTLLFIAISPAFVHASAVNTAAKQAIVIDYDTGAVLFEKNADQKMPTSSMSKVLTTYVIFDALKAGTIQPKDTFRVSEKAWRKGGSKMFVEVDKQISIEDLLRGVIIQSGNDATIVLAEGLSGTEDTFVQALNQTAQRLGMTDSHFMNASGWPDPDHYSTAQDLAKLAMALIKNHPEYYPLFSEKSFTFNEISQDNRNPLLYQDLGADGMKTGHTEIGGYGLIGSGKLNGRRIIIVINGLNDTGARAQEGKKLMRWGLNSFTNKTIVKSGDVIGNAPVLLGKVETIDLIAEEDLYTTVPIHTQSDIKITANIDGQIRAPITKGQKIGSYTVSIPDQDDITRPLFAAQDIEAKGFVAQSLYKVKEMVVGHFEKEKSADASLTPINNEASE